MSNSDQNSANLRTMSTRSSKSSINLLGANNMVDLETMDDIIYFDFLKRIQEPLSPQYTENELPCMSSNNIENNDLNDQLQFNSNERVQTTDFNSIQQYQTYLDLDDIDDPDFTCGDLNDVDDHIEEYFQIPKKETVDLVKDAIFNGDIPIVLDDQRNSKLKASFCTRKQDKLSLSKNNSFNQASSSTIDPNPPKVKSSITITKTTKNSEVNPAINEFPKVDDTSKTPEIKRPEPAFQPSTKEISNNGEYLPVFTDEQRKQLDEQLRNHVQLLTQVCLSNCYSKENSHIFDQAHNLLKVLDDIQTNDRLDSSEKRPESKICLSSEYDIINLKEALNIVDDIKKTDKEQFNPKNGVPSKCLEMIVSSPVFYNTNLIPSGKYRYQSQYTRAQFSDSEKILLILGYSKFKHLTRSECTQCIKEHLLPHRNGEDIKRQLGNISNTDQRQSQLNDLLRRQKKHEIIEFKKEIHYKSPMEQADYANLSSIYTIVIERLRMGNILKDTRKHLQEIKDKNIEPIPKENLKKRIRDYDAVQSVEKDVLVLDDSPVKAIADSANSKKRNREVFEETALNDTLFGDNDLSCLVPVEKSPKQSLKEKPIKMNKILEVLSNSQIIETPFKQNKSPFFSSVPTSTPKSLNRSSVSNSQNMSNPINTAKQSAPPQQPQSQPPIMQNLTPINLQSLTNQNGQLVVPSIILPTTSLQGLQGLQGLQYTILIQPTIHIHAPAPATSQTNDSTKTRILIPKNTNISQTKK